MDITNSLTILLQAIEVDKLNQNQLLAYREVKKALETERARRNDPNHYIFYT